MRVSVYLNVELSGVHAACFKLQLMQYVCVAQVVDGVIMAHMGAGVGAERTGGASTVQG